MEGFCAGQSMVSSLWHDCEFMGWVGQDARESVRCNAVLFPVSGM